MKRTQTLNLAIFTIFILGILYSCMNNYVYIEGYAQGTSYHITYKESYSVNYQHEIDSLLRLFDLSLSTYIPQSVISKVNQNQTQEVDSLFINVFNKAQEISQRTDGAFDMTVAPLVEAWGFGRDEQTRVSDSLIKSILQIVGFNKVKLQGNTIVKERPEIMLDCNAIAQGYAVDIIVQFLEQKGITNYMVELGGELRAKGKNAKGQTWRIGIDKPIEGSTENNRELQVVLKITDKAVATSGNYRRYYEKDGVKYSHTINPHTGYPVKHTLLSATIIADNCMTADALATACMVMGLDKSLQFVTHEPDIEGYFIYSGTDGSYKVVYTEAFDNMIEEIDARNH